MKRTVKKAVVIGLSTVMVVAGSVFAYAAESTSYMYAGGCKIKVRCGTEYDGNPEYCFTAVDSSNVVDIKINNMLQCIYFLHMLFISSIFLVNYCYNFDCLVCIQRRNMIFLSPL